VGKKTTTRREFLQAMGAGAAALAAPRWATGAPATRPNIVLIMCDDMGFSDIAPYGGEIHTPNLQGLADNGIRFTQFYNTCRCCPTRASLMTGLYPHQAGVGHMMGNYGLPGYRGDLSREAVTIAEVLKTAGYRTYMTGKWHLTPHTRPEGPKHNWPRQRGYDRFFGTIHGAYYTDAISDTAAAFIRDHARDHRDKPFFLYVAYTAPHWPMHAKPQDMANYKGRYAKGWDALRRERHARQIEMGLVKKEWKLTLRDPRAPAWDEEPMKPWQERRMEVYAAMVDCADQGIGRILSALDQTGLRDDTLVLFLAPPEGQTPRTPSPRPGPDPHGPPGHPRRAPGANGARGDARPARHLRGLWPPVGERLEHPIPPLQTLGARGRDRLAADPPLAQGHPTGHARPPLP